MIEPDFNARGGLLSPQTPQRQPFNQFASMSSDHNSQVNYENRNSRDFFTPEQNAAIELGDPHSNDASPLYP